VIGSSVVGRVEILSQSVYTGLAQTGEMNAVLHLHLKPVTIYSSTNLITHTQLIIKTLAHNSNICNLYPGTFEVIPIVYTQYR
jgi:hypothetical protein